MKVLQIETIYSGSGISGMVLSLTEALTAHGDECKFAFGRKRIPVKSCHFDKVFYVGDRMGVYCHYVLSRLFDRAGFYSSRGTKKLIRFIEEYKPDIIHLHSLLGYYINVKMLFEYLSRSGIPVVWTHHDCWAFTGRCIHFITADCEKWRTVCHDCPLLSEYPKSILADNSERNYKEKRSLFNSLEKMVSVAPSSWLASYLKESFLSSYPVKVIPNGIDRGVFTPTDSGIKKEMGISEKILLLAVASTWAETKGLDCLFETYRLMDKKRFALAVIGLSEKQIKNAPQGVIAMKRTNDVHQLVRWYSAADLFLNPTAADNFPTVNIEALSCGTPVVTFNTGGAGEMVGNCGMVVDDKTPSGLYQAVLELCKKLPSREECVRQAEKYDKDVMTSRYIKLYEDILKTNE